ncbi:hypothetical protein Pla52n_63350 [Stieleria varia]|uniref:Uncharacterized protein n=1 Tax=Stieleria varia TaxID=2528005 RepID=A0A5C5ZXP6_9BACT|nr:hypothetical protein Pla52n_63350 [Stieleria varia]
MRWYQLLRVAMIAEQEFSLFVGLNSAILKASCAIGLLDRYIRGRQLG